MFGFQNGARSADTHEVRDFQKDVIEESQRRPVLVDFWAPWCGPCRMLGPTLEKLAEGQEVFRLVKVNTDVNQQVAMEYGIRGIPAVKLFHRGHVVDDFMGALPEFYVKQWLDHHLQRLSEAEPRA
jgi:putative thioredoxin